MKKVHAIMDRKEDGSGLFMRTDDPTCKLADQYMRQLFGAGDEVVVILKSDFERLQKIKNENEMF